MLLWKANCWHHLKLELIDKGRWFIQLKGWSVISREGEKVLRIMKENPRVINTDWNINWNIICFSILLILVCPRFFFSGIEFENSTESTYIFINYLFWHYLIYMTDWSWVNFGPNVRFIASFIMEKSRLSSTSISFSFRLEMFLSLLQSLMWILRRVKTMTKVVGS